MSRIVYTEPGNVRGEIRNGDNGKIGVPLTPDYTDMCISCDLIAQYSSRLKNQETGTNSDDTIVISWQTYGTTDSKLSFFQGKDVDEYNFLTTDYTNIDFNEIRKRNIVEGLQIENININYTNYQTPQITIKFVDLRGGGFFAREEATHNENGDLNNLEKDKNDRIIDNIFSCFVSFPYPRFKLQVKGFYGRDVTFQLTCTSFNGSFNCNTGNFEFVVQFIGYEYGILGDIPFDLLIAAPITGRGSAYWAKQVNDMQNNGWALDAEKQQAPIKLIDFYKNINRSIVKKEFNKIDVDNNTQQAIENNVELITAYNDLKNSITKFINRLKKKVGEEYVVEYKTESEDGIVLFSNTKEKDILTNEIIEARDNIAKIIDNNQTLRNTDDIYTLIPNNSENSGYKKWELKSVEFTDFIKHVVTGNKHENIISNSSNSQNTNTVSSPQSFVGVGLTKMCTSENHVILADLSQEIYDGLRTHNWFLYGKDSSKGVAFAPYATIITFGSVKHLIDDKLSEIRMNYKDFVEKVDNQKNETIQKVLELKPYIGRYFKIVMCHFETFVNTIFECVDDIYNEIPLGERDPSKFGIYNMEAQTDVPNNFRDDVGNGIIPPFPAVYKKYTTEEETNITIDNGRNIVSNTWIGDFEGHWYERDLVIEYNKAAKKIDATRIEKMNENTVINDVLYTGLLPIFYIMEKLPTYAFSTDGGFLLYMGLMAEICLNMMFPEKKYQDMASGVEGLENFDLIQSMGAAVAYAYTITNTQHQVLKNLMESNPDIGDYMYNHTVYSPDFKMSQKDYEFAMVHEKRHPIFVEDSDNKVKYRYMTNDTTNIEIVPLQNFKKLNDRAVFANYYDFTNGDDFKVKDSTKSGFLIGSTTKGNNTYTDNNENASNCKIETNTELVKQIVDKIANMNIGDTKQFRTSCIMNFVNVGYISREDNKFPDYDSIIDNFISPGCYYFETKHTGTPNKPITKGTVKELYKQDFHSLNDTYVLDELYDALAFYQTPEWGRKEMV